MPERESKKKKATLTEVYIREMVLDDLPVVYALGEQIFTAEKWQNLYRTWDEYDLIYRFASDGEFCLVAEHDEKLIGFALGSMIEKRKSAWRYGYLEWLGVIPEAKRLGVGTKLFNELTELFIEKGARIMIVDTELENSGALSFFRRQGFDQEVEHIYLSRNLTDHPSYIKRKSTREPKSKNGD